ncbi:MAG: iron-sulfur cluster assembly scaffold protein [Candidatus Handelsmanbacteria bacterium RIFCSPLOWO2_12_FULL_64_10]|uniref:Iron-sulfur cluster assembly scaffold protein n=1 Tax=Handelsmanbacteria sp. (strain RIFCSPLOWO2_12_FULL_64_10) TaxID=1817868 RepID=A0A1F6D3Y3_HANXR|nr:MAG: iron-sulfur cluster assembly scaffold protein [Candidatus Handelsmanbacteria bacterium RIFCSPLOWO2_12_FULL_64_10]
MYNPTVIDHFRNPRNVGILPDPDGQGYAENSVCGDAMTLYLRVADGRIAEAKFRTFGCAAAIAASSALTEMLRGRSIEEALQIRKEDVAESLGGLPPTKLHCSVLAEDAVRAAVADYRKRQSGA